MTDLQFISALLPPWYEGNARPLPWRADREPYHVWLSEIMLQQTRAETVIPYYRRFLAALPSVADLAEAPEDRLLKLWEGLGYYSRARNLQKAARRITAAHGGIFPRTYEEILSLPGIGPYTAGAIGSICFGLQTPAVDGNVLRVLSRLTAFPDSVDTDAAKKRIAALLRPLYTPENSCVLTQSLMELGACVCLPNGAPKCEVCPLAAQCRANQLQRQKDFPVRGEKKGRKVVHKTVLLLRCGDCYAICRRPEKGLLAGLWEFPNRDAGTASDAADVKNAAAFARTLAVRPLRLRLQTAYTHVFTHVEWHMNCFFFDCGETSPSLAWVTREELEAGYALPSAFRPFLEKQDQIIDDQEEE